MSSTIQIERICEFCGNSFTAKTTVTKYCSHQCASRAYKQKTRGKKIERSHQETLQTIQKPIEELNVRHFLNLNEVQRLTGISRRTLYRMIERNELIIGKFGRRTVIRRLDIDAIFGRPYTKPPKKETEPITEFYTLKEVQEKYNVKYGYLNSIIQKNKIPKTTHDGKTFISKSHIDAFFKKKEGEIAHIKEWYSIEEIQSKFNLTRDQIYYRIHDHRIPKQKIGRFVKISKQHFEDSLKISI
jgi:excisionase family DNA binding protein